MSSRVITGRKASFSDRHPGVIFLAQYLAIGAAFTGVALLCVKLFG